MNRLNARFAPIVFLCCITLSAIAQEQSFFGPSLVFYALPMELIDPNKPAFSGGMEVKINEKWSAELSGGYSEFRRSGHKVRLEVKKYHQITQEENKIIRRYWSMGGFYHHYTFDQEALVEAEDGQDDYMTVGVDKVSMGMDVRWGAQMLFRSHVSLEFFAGLGVIYIDRKHNGPHTYRLGGGFFSHPKTQGDKLAPKLSLGLKLGGWLN